MSDKGSQSRRGWPLVLVVIVCVAAVVAVLTGATGPVSATQFANTGHWVYNSVVGMVFHVDGATTNIDAQLPVDADRGSQVLQSDTSGYVVGTSRITAFDKATQSTREPVRPPTDEVPLGLEVVGGPYAVYRNAGTIVRLGDPSATIRAGGPIGDPVVTDDGTMWFHRTGKGTICRLDRDAVSVSDCPASAPEDHPGALTIVDGRPAFVDLFTSELHTVDGDSLSAGIPLGVRLSPNSKPAAQDTDGRLAILDPGRSNLVLVDTRTRPATVVTKTLPRGDYAGPVSTGEVIALVDRQKDVVLTYDADGTPRDTKAIEEKAGEPRLSSGEDDRIYVEDADGTEVMVVGDDGSVEDVDVEAKPETPATTDTPDAPPGGTGDTGEPSGPPEPPSPPPTNEPKPEKKTPPPVPPSRPGAPLAVAATPGNGSATVTWNAAPDNRAPITSYQVTWPGGSATLGPEARQVVANGLTNGVAYTFTVTATNQVGTGPGASSPPVTPVAPVVTASPAAPPVSLRALYDENDRPTRDVTLTWGQPDLRGGTLMHYEVTNDGGLAPQTVTGTQAVYPQVEASQTITFTVLAVTQSPDGQTLRGEPASVTHENTGPDPTVTIAEGGPSDTDSCDPPDCAWVIATITGLDPDSEYSLQLSSDENVNVVTEKFTTDANGAATYSELNYDRPDHEVWVTVVETGTESNHIIWETP